MGWGLATQAITLLPFQFLTQHRNLTRTKQRLLEVANYLDQVGKRAPTWGGVDDEDRGWADPRDMIGLEMA